MPRVLAYIPAAIALLAVVLMVACIAVSALGSGITLRRFLRV